MLTTTLLCAALAQAPTTPLLERFTVDPTASEVGFHGDSTLHAFTGRTRAVTGEVRTVPGRPTELTAGWIRADARTLDTDNGERDEKMRAHLDVDRFPWIDFLITSATGSLDGGRGQLSVTGRFRIHGVERERSLALELRPEGAGLRAKGSCTFPMSEHGIAPPSVLVVTVDDPIEVFVDLLLLPIADEPAQVVEYRATVVERLEPLEGEPRELSREERLIASEEGLSWVRPGAGVWLASGADGARSFDLVADRELPAPPPAEAAFDEARERKQRLEEKIADQGRSRRARAVLRVIENLEAGLALTPAEGPARSSRDGDGLRIALGDATWLEARGRVGDHDLAPLLAAFEGVPAAVRGALAELDGVPEELVLRTAFPTGARTLTVRFAAGATTEAPRWATAPGSWIGVTDLEGSAPR